MDSDDPLGMGHQYEDFMFGDVAIVNSSVKKGH